MFKDLMPHYDGGLRMSKDYADSMEDAMRGHKNWKIQLIKLMHECYKAGEASSKPPANLLAMNSELREDVIRLSAQVDILMRLIENLKK